jgi:hypothetical protein
MKFLKMLLLFMTFLAAPGLADIEVGDIVINRTSGSVNVRVNMHNPGPSTARAPIAVMLYVKTPGDQDWREVKVWTSINKLAVGHRVSRDYFNDSPGNWDSAFNAPTFSVRATASSSAGVISAFEETYSGK